VALNHPRANRQPDAHTGKFILRVQALERAEELCRILHIKSHPVIADEVDPLSIALLGPELDPGVWTLACECSNRF
jgi:hypothetical protein